MKLTTVTNLVRRFSSTGSASKMRDGDTSPPGPPTGRVYAQPPPGGNASTASILDAFMSAAAFDPEEDHDEDYFSDDEDDVATSDSVHVSSSTSQESIISAGEPGARGESKKGRIAAGYVTRDTINELALDTIDSIESDTARAQQKSKTRAEEEADGSFMDYEEEEVDSEEKKAASLKRIEDEFGVWCEPGGEDFIKTIPGALYRNVLVKGTWALTSRRLCYLGFIPVLEEGKVVKSGPATLPMAKNKRVWFELKPDSVSFYRSSDKLYKPIASFRLSGIKEVLPWDEEKPLQVHVALIDGRQKHIEFDTVESCIEWRNVMESTLFTFRATADRLRLCIGLHRIRDIEWNPYMGYAERVKVIFDAQRSPSTPASGVQTPASEGSPSPSMPSRGNSVSSSDSAGQSAIEFGFIETHHSFITKLREATDLAQKNPPPCDHDPILEIDSQPRQDEDALQNEQDEAKETLQAKFARTFALNEDPTGIWVTSAEFVRTVPTWGNLAVAKSYLCFWRRSLVGADVKLRIPWKDIEEAVPAKAWGFTIFGLAVHIHGAPDIRFDFHTRATRDQAIKHITDGILSARLQGTSLSPAPTVSSFNDSSSLDSPTSPVGGGDSIASRLVLGQPIDEDLRLNTVIRAAPIGMIGNIGRRTLTPRHFVCLTIGSRGDVQPYISLGLELMKDGHRVTIASHPEYRAWVEGYGIGYREVGGDPGALMKLSIEHKMFSPGFFRESLGHFREWLDNLFLESWEATQGADVLIESPSTFAGIHCAEALGIPYFRAFTMPWTRTATYPQAFSASVELGPNFNLVSYDLFDQIIWRAMSGQVNKWRKNTLGLKPTTMHRLSAAKTPFIYNFSSSVVPRPNDWRDFISISGYWFLDTPEGAWEPSDELAAFIAKARTDNAPIIYVGFGSILVPDSAAVTQAVVNAVLASGVRCILVKGWSERGQAKGQIEVPLPEEIFKMDSVPHDRLFPLIDAACHHGGAGSTGASLRAGLPTLIHPFFGDQPFWASRVTKLGAGMKVESLTEKALTAAFIKATTDRIMKEKAAEVGVKIRAENGPRNAISFIYDHMRLAQERGDLRAARARGEHPVKPNSRQSSSRSRSSRDSSTLSGDHLPGPDDFGRKRGAVSPSPLSSSPRVGSFFSKRSDSPRRSGVTTPDVISLDQQGTITPTASTAGSAGKSRPGLLRCPSAFCDGKRWFTEEPDDMKKSQSQPEGTWLARAMTRHNQGVKEVMAGYK